MGFLVPRFPARHLPCMLGYALLGALVAGLYGILHDQITYSISPEYFTKLKFHQFSYANFGWPTRIFVAEIGFLASWWVGLFSGWFLARIAVPAWPHPVAFRRTMAGFALTFGGALAGAVTGFLFSNLGSGHPTARDSLCHQLGITETKAFIQVAHIHNGSYLGGTVGLLAAIILLHRWRKG